MNRGIVLTLLLGIGLVVMYQCAGPMQRLQKEERIPKKGIELYQQGEYERALTELRTALGSHPKAADLHYYKGLAHLHLDQLDSAMVAYDQGFQLEKHRQMDSTYAAIMAQRASVLVDTGRYDVAMTWAEQALEIHSENRLARYERFMAEGLKLYHTGSEWKLWDAIVAFGKAYQVMPDKPMPYYYTARCYHKKDDKDFAHIIPNYEKALERDPPPEIAQEIKKRLKEQRRRKKLYEDFWGD